MWLYLSLGGIIVAGLAGLTLLGLELRRVRILGDQLRLPERSLGALAQHLIDRWYYQFAHFFRAARHYSILYFLLGARRALLITRFVITRVERRFARLIEAVRGQQPLRPGGSVSLFLSEIKQHKDAAMSQRHP